MTQSSITAGPIPFGTAFTDHMVTIRWTAGDGWHPPRLSPYATLSLDPASVGLHYGQIVFEGLKAYRRTDGSIAIFRPIDHARRFQSSARRLAMPELPEQMFVKAVADLVREDGRHLPDDHNLSLYLRPVLFASEPCLALRPAREYLFLLVAFVTGGYFADQPDPVSVWISRAYSRAAPGGTGRVKYAGNYAASYLAQLEATGAGCHQVVWLDPVERRWVEEMGGMNLFFVRGRGAGAEVVTPELTDTLLPGITRDSLLALAAQAGYRSAQERVSVEQWRFECGTGVITETFACGTAALVTPVGSVRDGAAGWQVGDGAPGPVTLALRDALTAVHRDRTADQFGWMHPVH